MKNRILLLLLTALLGLSSLAAEIVEVPHFEELTKAATPTTLVLVDIDDTILIPKQTLGNDAWFGARWNDYKAQGLDTSKALEKTLAEWEAIRHITKVELVEPETANILRTLQDSQIMVMGITNQGLALATRTVLQLQDLGVDLSKTAPWKEDAFFLEESHGVLYRHGILFTSGKPKGPSLMDFLNKIGYKPEHIVAIDDKASNVANIASSVEAAGIPFLGLRYSFGDERVKAYRQEIADIQLQHSTFLHILSDEEAETLLPINKDIPSP